MEKSIEALSEDIRVCDPNYNYGYEYGGSNSSLNSMKSNFNIDDPIIRIKVSFFIFFFQMFYLKIGIIWQ